MFDPLYSKILNIFFISLEQVWLTVQHNWPFLLVSTIVAVWLKRSFDAVRISTFLRKNRRASVVAATTAAVATPLCSCGTTAVVLGMMASMMPWAPIVAFMVASPLTSHEELIYSAGLFGWPFAWAFFLASILLGLAAGIAATLLERRGWLDNQLRFQKAQPVSQSRLSSERNPDTGCSCKPAFVPLTIVESNPADAVIPASATCACANKPAIAFQPAVEVACGCSPSSAGEAFGAPRQLVAQQKRRNTSQPVYIPDIAATQDWLKDFFSTGSRLLAMFLGFAFLGYFINGLIPAEWVVALFGKGNVYSVPLAATLGLPFYLNTEASLPLVRAMLDQGMSHGAALAFMIAGAGTSIGAIAGALTIARYRVVVLVVATLWIGAMVCGFVYNLF